MKCERCGAQSGDVIYDYCAACSRNLCNACMALGCCGQVPAMSGVDKDYGDEDDDSTHCEGCGVNLDEYPCLCGPAGPKLNGVYTGDNARGERDSEGGASCH